MCPCVGAAPTLARWAFDESGGALAADTGDAGLARDGLLQSGAYFSGGQYGGVVYPLAIMSNTKPRVKLPNLSSDLFASGFAFSGWVH